MEMQPVNMKKKSHKVSTRIFLVTYVTHYEYEIRQVASVVEKSFS